MDPSPKTIELRANKSIEIRGSSELHDSRVEDRQYSRPQCVDSNLHAKWNQNVISPYNNYKNYTKIVKENLMSTSFLFQLFQRTRSVGFIDGIWKNKGPCKSFSW